MWGQRDPRWAYSPLGSSSDTIGADGCYLTSDADLMTWTGHTMDPAQLNQAYLDKGIFVDGELLQDSALHDAYPDLWSREDDYTCPSSPCDQNQLNNDAPNRFVICEITNQDGSLTHFVPITDWRNWMCADPWTDSVISIGQVGANFGWGSDPATLIMKVVRLNYIGGGATPSPAPAPNATSFQGTIAAGGAHVRVLPGLDQAIVQQPGANPDIVDAGTSLTFDGWCHHAPSGRSADVTVPMDTAFNPPRPDDRWFRVQTSGHWISSPGVDYANGADPPIALLVADPAPPPAPPVPQPETGPVAKTIPPVLQGFSVWETSPSYNEAADYAALAKVGVSAVIIKAANGDGTGANDASIFEPNWRRASQSISAGITPVAWTAWYGPGAGPWGGVTGDVASYLLGCAKHTAELDAKMTPSTAAWIVDAENPSMAGLPEALAELSRRTGKPVIINPVGDPQTQGIQWDWSAVNAAVAASMPQMYTKDWGAAMTFDKALAQLLSAGLSAPMIPILDETDPTQITAVVARAKAVGATGISFWYAQAGSAAAFQNYLGAWSKPPAPAPKPPITPTPTPPSQPQPKPKPHTLPPPPPPGVLAWLEEFLTWLKRIFG